MKLIRKMSILLLICILCSYVILYVIVFFKGYPIIIYNESNYDKSKGCALMLKSMNQYDIINPISHIDFDNGNWCIYLVMESSDIRDLPPNIKKSICLVLTDQDVIRNIKQYWRFTCTGGDMATVDSYVFFVKDGTVQFKSGIVINEFNPGLQDLNYGWITPIDKTEFLKLLSNFKRKIFPVVIMK